MRILLVITSLDVSKGGPSRSVPTLARGLSELGHYVTLLTVRSEAMNVACLRGTEVVLETVDEKCSREELEAVFNRGRFDVVHAQSLWELFYRRIQRIAAKRGIPFVSTPRGSLEPWALELHAWKKKLALALYQRRDLNNSACVLATSDQEAEHIRQAGVKAPVCVIPNALDMSEFPCRSNGDGAARQVLFLSRIHPKKGIEILLDAWQKLHERFPEWTLLLVGNGDPEYIEVLHGIISRKGLAHCVQMLPPYFGEDKIELYHSSAVFVLPSWSENFGMVVAEAMACGLPVITTTGTPWEVLASHGLGWWIDLSVDNLAEALDEALSLPPGDLVEMGRRASAYVRENFDYHVIAQKVTEMYAALSAPSGHNSQN